MMHMLCLECPIDTFRVLGAWDEDVVVSSDEKLCMLKVNRSYMM